MSCVGACIVLARSNKPTFAKKDAATRLPRWRVVADRRDRPCLPVRHEFVTAWISLLRRLAPGRRIGVSKAVGGVAEILLVEDNPADVRLMQEALKECKLKINLYVTKDGVDAMSYLGKEGAYAKMPKPDLILLDLYMPRKSGFQVLAEIKRNPALAMIPVVILTASEAEQDIAASYDLHANCYIVKPFWLDPFVEIIQSLYEFWKDIAKLPPN